MNVKVMWIVLAFQLDLLRKFFQMLLRPDLRLNVTFV